MTIDWADYGAVLWIMPVLLLLGAGAALLLRETPIRAERVSTA